MDAIFDAVRPSKIERVAGSGNKFLHMAENLSDYYLNFVPGFKYWDMCGSEAIIRSRFGIVTNAKGGPLTYDPNTSPNYTHREGIIASQNLNIYQENKQRIESTLGMGLDDAQKMI